MKKMKKIVSLLLALVMTFAMASTVFAGQDTNPAPTTGSITIKSADNVDVAGKTFNAYKILDVELAGEAYVYTVPDSLKAWYAEYFDVSVTAGDFSAQIAAKISDKAIDLFEFAADALAAAKMVNVAPVSATAGTDANEVTIGNLPLGYYVVEDVTKGNTVVSALMLNTTNPNMDVTIKADKPSIDKKIDENGTLTETNNAAIGDTVNFVVKSAVPNMVGYKKYYFVVNDTMSKGLTFNNDVAITLGKKTLVKDTDYTVEVSKPDADGNVGIEIVFKNFIQYRGEAQNNESGEVTYPNNLVGSEIKITYTATVNENAVIGVAGNPNTVKLEYSNNPNKDSEGDPENPDKPGPNDPTGETPESKTKTYVTGIKLTKIDNTGKILTGAKFQIAGEKLSVVVINKEIFKTSETGTWYLLKDGTYTETAPVEGQDNKAYDVNADGSYTKYEKVIVVEKETKTEPITAEGYVNAEGILVFEGLAEGSYTITELVAPDGYNILTSPINVTIKWTDPVDPEKACEWTFNATLDGKDLLKDEQGDIAAFEVVNQAGSLLPSTGGIGTTIFYVVGTILVLGAGILLVTKRRMKAQ